MLGIIFANNKGCILSLIIVTNLFIILSWSDVLFKDGSGKWPMIQQHHQSQWPLHPLCTAWDAMTSGNMRKRNHSSLCTVIINGEVPEFKKNTCINISHCIGQAVSCLWKKKKKNPRDWQIGFLFYKKGHHRSEEFSKPFGQKMEELEFGT